MALPLLAAAGIGAAGSIIGGMMTNSANKEMNEANNAANMQMSAENRAWQERMSNTAHQREVSDLKLAGLNPVLTATGGSGASTGSGSMATMNANRVEDVLGKGVSSALQVANLQKDLEMADSQKALNASAVQTQQSQQEVNAASAMKTRNENITLANKNYMAEPTINTLRAAAAEAASADLKRAKIDNKMATYDAINTRVQNTLDTVNSAKDVANPFKGLIGPGKNIPPSGEIFKNREGQTGYYDKSGSFKKTN